MPTTRPVLSAISVPSRAGARPSGRMPTRFLRRAVQKMLRDPVGAGKIARRPCGACRWTRPDWLPPDRCSRRCHGRKGKAPLPAAGCRARPDRWAALRPRPATRGRLVRHRLPSMRNLEAVFAGIAGAADDGGRAGDGDAFGLHECQLGDARRMALQHIGRQRALAAPAARGRGAASSVAAPFSFSPI